MEIAALICALIALAILAFLLLSGGMKEFFLNHTSFSDGVIFSIGAGALIAVFGLVIGARWGLWPSFFGLSAGSLLGAVLGTWLWNSGRFDVQRNHRALLEWNGARQPGKEASEGRRWGLPFFVGHHDYDMLEDTLAVTATVEVDNNTRIGIQIASQQKPAKGRLFAYSEVAQLQVAVTNLLTGAAQMFANSKKTLDNLTDREGPEELKAFLLKVLRLRSAGQLCLVKFDDGTLELVEGEGVASDWGLEVIDLVIKDFELPDSIAEAGSEVTEAGLREQAAAIRRDSMDKTMARLEGRDPTHIAAALTVDTDRPVPISVFHVPGLDKSIERGITACGMAAAGAFKPVPATRTPRARKSRTAAK